MVPYPFVANADAHGVPGAIDKKGAQRAPENAQPLSDAPPPVNAAAVRIARHWQAFAAVLWPAR
jgi:hypothetical protein